MPQQPILVAVAWPYASGPRHLGHVAGFGDALPSLFRLRAIAHLTEDRDRCLLNCSGIAGSRLAGVRGGADDVIRTPSDACRRIYDVGMPPYPVPRPVQLSAEVAGYIRELVVTGQLSGGTALNIDRLARTLEVSATPVREALQLLHAEGFVTFEPRRGYRVAPLSPQDIRDVYWLQASIARELAARAVHRLAEADLLALVDIQQQMREALDTGEQELVEELNHRFHRTLNLAAGAPKLAWMLNVLVKYAPRRFYSTVSGWVAASLADHEAIIAACRSGDSYAAGEAMRAHIQHAGELLANDLAQRAGLPPAQ